MRRWTEALTLNAKLRAKHLLPYNPTPFPLDLLKSPLYGDFPAKSFRLKDL